MRSGARVVGKVASLALTPEELDELWRCAREHPNAVRRSRALAPLGPGLRLLAAHVVPELAGARIVKLMTVLLGAGTEQGDRVDDHAHPEHTVLLYAQPSALTVEGELLHFDAGDVVYLPPDVVHRVGLQNRPRLSVALLLETAGPVQ